ncbi:MAG TPA: hypothetical protein VJ952_11985 [Opitutales bacterium]|nr:hypothetical protein [Opitutales bacterium]
MGIDSDGTVFDSMVIKHRRVFQPVAIDLWNLNAIELAYCALAETINLFSLHRGINRFAGLAIIFRRLAEQTDEGGTLLQGQEDLEDFVASGEPLSHAALASYNRSRKSAFLEKVLEWSRRCDALYSEIMEEEGNPVFPYVHDSLGRASERADIVVISSSSRMTLEHDWKRAGLFSLVKTIEGQEHGSKTCQLKGVLEAGYENNCALMLGDALSDLESAREHDILFYPIKPGAEKESWERFFVEALPRFFDGGYGGEYERKLLKEFQKVLVSDGDPQAMTRSVFQNS